MKLTIDEDMLQLHVPDHPMQPYVLDGERRLRRAGRQIGVEAVGVEAVRVEAGGVGRMRGAHVGGSVRYG